MKWLDTPAARRALDILVRALLAAATVLLLGDPSAAFAAVPAAAALGRFVS